MFFGITYNLKKQNYFKQVGQWNDVKRDGEGEAQL